MELENKVLTSAVFNNSLCRVCLSSSENNRCIFRMNQDDYKSTGVLNFLQKLQLCSGVEVVENDGLPTTICTTCSLKVNAAYTLREQCQRADARLRELHGIPLKKYNVFRSTNLEDKCCQTEQISTDYMKIEADVAENWRPDKDSSSCKNESNKSKKDDSLQCVDISEEIDARDNQTNWMDIDNKRTKNSEQEKSTIKKDAVRTRKLSMFKMVTSMESLKNNKERQRQYIKKNSNNKHDATDKSDPLSKTTSGNIERFTNSECKTSYKCPECDRCYLNKASLGKHILTHGKKVLSCDKCDMQFFHFAELLEHGKVHTTKEKSMPVQCKICEKSFRKTDTMVRHLNVHKRANPKEVFSILKDIRDKRKLENNLEHMEGNVEAKVKIKALSTNRDRRFKSSKVILESQENINFNNCSPNSEPNSDNDLESLNNTSLYRCNQCTKHYSSERSLQRHLLIHDEKKFVCNVCNMKFFRADRLKSHKDKHGHNQDKESLEPQKPPDDKSAIKLINSWIREELDSDNEGKGFPCKICGKSYDTKKSLLKHEVNVHNSQHENCTECGENCNCTEKSKHQGKVTEKSKSFICDVCNKSFEKENQLQKHVRIHERSKEQQDSNFKRFLCHICSKTFRQNTGLMFHMRTHTGYKPHVCKYCGRGFTSNSNCINHERTHTGDRPFVCHFCSAAFAKSCTLKAHITTHTGEANYHCKTCGKSFRRLKYLKEHRFTHTGEKPYACKICGTAYSHSGSLFVHEKKCKAQYNNYQALSIQSTQSYCQLQTNISSSVSIVPPNLTSVSATHISNINNTVGPQLNKNYIEDVQRMHTHSVGTAIPTTGPSGLHSHQNQDAIDSAAPVRSFTIIGQVFHS